MTATEISDKQAVSQPNSWHQGFFYKTVLPPKYSSSLGERYFPLSFASKS